MKKGEVKKNYIVFAGLLYGAIAIHAQCPFTGPDTVCVGQPVLLMNWSGGPCGEEGVNTHKWFYESATVEGMPSASVITGVHGGWFLNSAKDNGNYYVFVTGAGPTPYIYRQKYGNSVLNSPVEDILQVQVAVDSQYVLEGIDLVKDDVWYAFVVGTQPPWNLSKPNKFSDVLRLRFTHGIEDPNPEITELSLPDSLFFFPHEIMIVQDDNGHWYGAVANEKDTSLVILDFTQGLNGPPSSVIARRYGYYDATYNPSGSNGLSGFSMIKENGVWHVLASSHATPAHLIRFDFVHGFGQPPVTTDLGNPDNSMDHTEDVAFIYDCNYLMAVTVSDDNSLTLLKFDSTVTGTLHGEKYANIPSFSGPHGMSDIYNENGYIYSFVCNTNSVSLMKFSPPAQSHTNPPGLNPDTFEPSVFSYNAPGRYNINLMVDNDVSKTSCHTVFVMNPPAKPIDINPRWVCYGEKITGITDSSVNAYRARFEWTFPDGSTHEGRSPLAGTSGIYSFRNVYDQCKGDTIKRYVTVANRPAPPSATDVVSCPEKKNTTALSVYNIKPKDSIVWYKDYLLTQPVFSSSTQNYFIPGDSVLGIHDYYVVRYPFNSACVIKSSDSVKVRLTLRRPDPPVAGKDSTFCLGDAYSPLYCIKTSVRWYDTPLLDTIRSTSPMWTPEISSSGIHHFYVTYDSSGCWSKPAVVTLTVKETPMPLVNDVYLCKGVDSTYNKCIQAVPSVPGGIIKFYDSTDFSVPPLPSPGNAFCPHATQTGTLTFWVVQYANGCNSPGKKVLFTIDETPPPALYYTDTSYYSCVGKFANPLKVIPLPGYSRIEWKCPQCTPEDTGTIYYPQIDVSQPGTYLFQVRQKVNKCFSPYNTIKLAILPCDELQPKPLKRCNTDSVLNLFSIYDPGNRLHQWQDNDYTGALKDSIVDLTLPAVKGTRVFQYYNKLLYLRVDKQLYAGLPRDTSISVCENPVKADSYLRNRDEGGTWKLGNTPLLSSLVTLKPGTNIVRYIIPVTGGCKADSSQIRFLADSLPLLLTCPEPAFHSLDVGVAGLLIESTELDPVVADGCNNYTLANSINALPSLDSTYFSLHNKAIESYEIRWIAYDPFEHRDTCYTRLTIATFKIPNLFTPNDDGVNDRWEFSLDKTPGAKVLVYNRWGNKIWEATGNVSWDGIMKNGYPAPPDAYSYVITHEGKIIYKGTVTLVR